jgi:hypothetical protein
MFSTHDVKGIEPKNTEKDLEKLKKQTNDKVSRV